MHNQENSLSYYLPDFGRSQAIVSMVLSIELIVIMLSLFKYSFASSEFYVYFAGLSFVMLWIAFVFALLMHLLRGHLQKMTVHKATFIKLSVLLTITLLFFALGRWIILSFLKFSDIAESMSTNVVDYFIQNGLISLIVGGLLLRYFYIAKQNEEKLKAMNNAQIQALQSRIRPHFLFNSLNSIASLVRIDAEKAEQAVEDLSDLFRVSLANSERRVSIKEELEIARLYQRMEQLRLGERLQVKWNVSNLPLRQKVPALMLQPLLENAIYHGIEPITQGGTVHVNGYTNEGRVCIDVINPVESQPSAEKQAQRKQGNKIALENIQSRLRLLYGEKASVNVMPSEHEFKVQLSFPIEA